MIWVPRVSLLFPSSPLTSSYLMAFILYYGFVCYQQSITRQVCSIDSLALGTVNRTLTLFFYCTTPSLLRAYRFFILLPTRESVYIPPIQKMYHTIFTIFFFANTVTLLYITIITLWAHEQVLRYTYMRGIEEI